MFMEAPLPQKEEQPEAAPEAPAPVDGTSDAKGWTVFMDKPPVQMPAGKSLPSGPMGFAPAGDAAPAPVPAPADQVGAGKTVIAGGGMQAPAGGMVPPEGGAAVKPMEFKGSAAPSGAGGADVVNAPQTSGAVERRPGEAPAASQPPSTAVAPGQAAPIVKKEGGGGMKIVIGLVVVAGIAAGVYFGFFAG